MKCENQVILLPTNTIVYSLPLPHCQKSGLNIQNDVKTQLIKPKSLYVIFPAKKLTKEIFCFIIIYKFRTAGTSSVSLASTAALNYDANVLFIAPARMPLPRFFSDKLENNTLLVDPQVVHQLKHVLRQQSGDKIIILDNQGWTYQYQLGQFNPQNIALTLLEKTYQPPPRELHLLAALGNHPDKWEMIVQRTTELGVTHLHPMLTEHTDPHAPNRFKPDRLQKIIKEAAEQSQRHYLPRLFSPEKFNSIIKQFASFSTLVFDPSGKNATTDDYAQATALVIGPEGGFSPAEIELVRPLGCSILGLGSNILRLETAAISTTALCLLTPTT